LQRTDRKLAESWAHRRFTDRLDDLSEERRNGPLETPEFESSQVSPDCGSVTETNRNRERFTRPCGYDGHADVTAARTLLGQPLHDGV
jgi:putative transposase